MGECWDVEFGEKRVERATVKAKSGRRESGNGDF
jgi:hypothetical protein